MVGSAEIRAEKRRLRGELRAARRAIDPAAAAQAKGALASHAIEIPLLHSARTVAGYMASDGELELDGLLGRLRERGVVTLLPHWQPGGEIRFASVDDATVLHPSRVTGILEPEDGELALEEQPRPAVLLTPSVALDSRGARLGRGGGAYDRLIPRLRALDWIVIGVCHASAVVDLLPTEPHDCAVQAILTEHELRWIR